MSVWVSILPQLEMVQLIGGDAVDVSVLVGPGESPATYEPTPRQMAGLHEADLLVTIGVPFERALLPRLIQVIPAERVVDSARDVKREPISEQETGLDEHFLSTSLEGQPDGETGHHHGHGAMDPHIWLDPLRMKTVAAAVCEDLCRLRPDQCEGFRARMEAYAEALDAIDGRISLRLAPLAGQEVLVLHPAFGYLLRRYGLRQVAVEIDGKEPAARSLARLIERARASGTTVLFVQPQFAGRSADAVAEAIGGRVVELDPLAQNHLANLELIVDRIASAYGTGQAENGR